MKRSFVALVRQALLVSAAVAFLLGATVIAGLAFPQPLFAHRVEHGRLQLFSDRPFQPENGRRVLAEVERRLARSPLDDGGVHRVFVANSPWQLRLTFLWNFGAGGVNYSPLTRYTRNVFIRPADIDNDRVMNLLGVPIEPPRTLVYFITHEIGHTIADARLGPLENTRLPVWIREGLADYIAFAGDVDVDALTRAWLAGDRDLDPKRSGLYARYRLLVAHFLEREGWSVEQLLASNLPQDEAERRLRATLTR